MEPSQFSRSTEAKVINGTTLLAVMEQYHSPGKGVRTILYASDDGKNFSECQPPWFEEIVKIPVGSSMGSHLCLHQNDSGDIVRFGVTRILGTGGHYSRCLFEVKAFTIDPQ